MDIDLVDPWGAAVCLGLVLVVSVIVGSLLMAVVSGLLLAVLAGLLYRARVIRRNLDP